MNDETYVQLTSAEIQMAAFVGCQRTVENLKNGIKDKYGADPDKNWQLSIEGALAEFALAKLKNKYWWKGRMKGLDVDKANVRSTALSYGSLILHPEDEDDVQYYLMIGSNGNYKVAGSILAKDGKLEKYWKTHNADGTVCKRPAYFVPQRVLKPYDFLDD